MIYTQLLVCNPVLLLSLANGGGGGRGITLPVGGAVLFLSKLNETQCSYFPLSIEVSLIQRLLSIYTNVAFETDESALFIEVSSIQMCPDRERSSTISSLSSSHRASRW